MTLCVVVMWVGVVECSSLLDFLKQDASLEHKLFNETPLHVKDFMGGWLVCTKPF